VLDVHQSPTTAYKVKGWRRVHTQGNLADPKSAYVWGDEKMINLVTDNYQLMAKGNDDAPTKGTSVEDPIETELLSSDFVKLTLAHYNTEGEDDDVFNHS